MALDFDKEKEKIREFIKNFYAESEDGTKVFTYAEQMVDLAERTQTALSINLDDVHEFDPELAEAIRANARRYHTLYQEVMDELIREHLGDRDPPVIDALDSFIYQRLTMDRAHKNAEGAMGEVHDPRKKYPPQLLRRYELMFKSRVLDKAMNVRDIKAAYVGKLVTVGGSVIRAAEVRPMASVMTYTCDTCGSEAYQPVNGPTFNPAQQCPSSDCVESRANGRLHMQIRGSKMVKFQEIKIQEHSDQVPVGSIPRLLSINVYGEMTRTCAPGDTVRITGVLVPLLRQGFKQVAGGLVTDVYLECHTIENLSTREEDSLAQMGELTDEEIERVSQDNFYDLLAYSIAPEIYGHTDVKKSLLLALVGGVDKNANGMKIRGALNILLMGDPGVAKSQLLSYVDRLAPRSQYTTGRGSSGVGLTAAVCKDPHTGEMTLEGGALVLADRGICCIDEFDKMMDQDRTAIHEVMEQQTISIAKAGILTTLNARVSIVAAANPAYGRYNPHKSIEQNVDLPAALLSRFDVLWLMQDKADREADRRLAQHITYVHMKGHQPEITGMQPMDMATVRRYIAMCKKKEPVVEERLREKIVDMYVEMRRESRESSDSTFTSPRLLLSVIRMATALARLRLSDRVCSSDVDEAIRLMHGSKASLRPELLETQCYKTSSGRQGGSSSGATFQSGGSRAGYGGGGIKPSAGSSAPGSGRGDEDGDSDDERRRMRRVPEDAKDLYDDDEDERNIRNRRYSHRRPPVLEESADREGVITFTGMVERGDVILSPEASETLRVLRSTTRSCTPKEIDALPRTRYDAADVVRRGDLCPICLAPLSESPLLVLVILPCKHLGHSECMRHWLLQGDGCPSCRNRVFGGETFTSTDGKPSDK